MILTNITRLIFLALSLYSYAMFFQSQDLV